MLNLGVRRCKMAKKQKIDLQSVGVLAVLAFAWSKLGLGAATKDVLLTTRVVPGNWALPDAPEDWKATLKDGAYNKQNPLPGYESAGDFGVWLLWKPKESL